MSNGEREMYLRLGDVEKEGQHAVKVRFEQLVQETEGDYSKIADLGVAVQQKIIDNWVSRHDALLCLYLMLEDLVNYKAKSQLEHEGYHHFCEAMNRAEKKIWMLEVYDER